MSSPKALPGMTLKAPKGLQYDKRKEGWKLIREGSPVVGEPDLEFVPFLRDGEEYVPGTVALGRSKEMPGSDAGQHHAERMLANQADIPVELRDYYLVFPETEWEYPDGNHYVPSLSWSVGQWILHFLWVEDGLWDAGDRLVRLRK